MFTSPTNQEPISLFLCLQHSQLKGCVTKDKKILLSSQNVPNNWFLNIYSQQNSTYLDSRADLQNYADSDFSVNVYNPWIWNFSRGIYVLC